MLEEAFKAEPAGWSFAATSRTPPLRFDAPGLVVTLPGGETSVAAYWYEKQQFADFSVSVTVALLSAQEPTQSYAGISFRAKSDKDNYRVFIDGEGYYRLTRRVELWRGTGYKGHPRLRGLQDTPGGDAEPDGP